MGSALTTMAILKANWDENRDYLSNFQPFVDDVLRKSSPLDPVDPAAVAQGVRGTWGISIPQMTIDTMLRRAKKSGLLERGADGPKLFVVPGAAAEADDLEQERGDALRSMNALVDHVRRHAAEQDLQWSESQAEDALLLYLDEYSSVFATSRRSGGMPLSTGSTGEALSIVHSLARHAAERDPVVLELLDRAVKGSMLANVIHLKNPTDKVGKLDKLVVYLDTSLVVRLLGVSVPQLAAAAQEMLDLLKQGGVPVRIFDHTVVETEGVLRSVAHNLRVPRSRATSDTARMSWQRREVLDYFLNEGKGAGDVEEVIANLERRLMKIGVQVESTPEHVTQTTLDEEKLQEALRDGIGYRVEAAGRHRGAQNQSVTGGRIPALDRDLDSLSAIHRLRGGKVFRNLGQCPAVFLTNNRKLARVSRAFFREEGVGAGVPHCYTDSELVTQLWIRSPSRAPDLPRKAILADSYAALNPSPQLWERYVTKIEQMAQEGDLTHDDVTNLVYSTTARSVLSDLTHGELSRFDDDKTIGQVLQATRDDAQAEAVAESKRAAAAESALKVERAVARREQDRLLERLTASGDERDELAKRLSRLERIGRRIGYGALALICVAGLLMPWVLSWSTALVIAVDTVCLIGGLLFALAMFLNWRMVFDTADKIIGVIGVAGIVALVVALAKGNTETPSSPASDGPAAERDRP